MSVAARVRRPRAPPFLDPPGYARHRPETTLLYRLVERHYPAFRALRCESGRPLPEYVEQEFEAYLKCGCLEHGFLRVRCEECHAEKLVAFSCKRRGFCPACGARRMAEAAALLVDEVLPARSLRQWVLSLPHALRFLLHRAGAASAGRPSRRSGGIQPRGGSRGPHIRPTMRTESGRGGALKVLSAAIIAKHRPKD